MNSITSFWLLLTMLMISPLCGQDLQELTDFGDNPGDLQMFSYVPTVNQPSSLVVVLHGCTQSAESMARLTGWNKLAREVNFIVLYPQQKPSNNPLTCFNWFNSEDVSRDSGEIVSIRNAIKQLIDRGQVDPEKVYVTGMSAGGAMASALLSVYPEVFAAGAIMSGVPYGGVQNVMDGMSAMGGNLSFSKEEYAGFMKAASPMSTTRMPRVAVFHGVKDDKVVFKNAEELILQFSAIRNIEKDSAIQSFDNNPYVNKRIYLSGNGIDDLVLYRIDSLGHALVIDPGEGIKQGGEVDAYAVDLDFHSTYWAAEFFYLID